ncbi:hypothetical protein C8J57DRAFT_1490241 [Mycena rebaudengoi]|nr:hypothetical protein C8J57DRAFT_1490241 [Mycena rebaudengoi]
MSSRSTGWRSPLTARPIFRSPPTEMRSQRGSSALDSWRGSRETVGDDIQKRSAPALGGMTFGEVRRRCNPALHPDQEGFAQNVDSVAVRRQMRVVVVFANHDSRSSSTPKKIRVQNATAWGPYPILWPIWHLRGKTENNSKKSKKLEDSPKREEQPSSMVKEHNSCLLIVAEPLVNNADNVRRWFWKTYGMTCIRQDGPI